MVAQGFRGPVTRTPSLYIWSPPPMATWNGCPEWTRRTSFQSAGPEKSETSVPTENPSKQLIHKSHNNALGTSVRPPLQEWN